MADRFHKAARDGYLEALKEATRKDLNTKDEDGMTPTLWASFEGNLDALRLIVGRGGDPDKCDNYGNSALHFAAARGHMPCVSFLVNFGINMWALDIDFHSAKDLAAINSRDDILRFLDAAIAKEETKEPKKVKGYKEKGVRDAEKRAKDFEKLQKKASKQADEESKKLAKARKEMEKGGHGQGYGSSNGDTMGGTVNGKGDGPRPSMAFLSLRKDSRLLYASSPKFSEIVANQAASAKAANQGGGTGGHFTSGVYKKVQAKKGQTVAGNKAPVPDSDFKVAEIESDGKRSIRSLSGLRRDSEVMYVPKYDISTQNLGKRGKIDGLFEDITNTDGGDGDYDRGQVTVMVRRGSESPPPPNRGTVGRRAGSISGIGMTRSISQPDYMQQVGADGELEPGDAVPSIFERPGFGSMAFRNSITSTLANFPNFSESNGNSRKSNGHQGHGSGQSRPSKGKSNGHGKKPVYEESDDDVETGPVELFLAAAGLSKYIPTFIDEKIDLTALMLLTEDDLKSIGIEMGPRRKLLKAIRDREAAIQDPGEVIDSRL